MLVDTSTKTVQSIAQMDEDIAKANRTLKMLEHLQKYLDAIQTKQLDKATGNEIEFLTNAIVFLGHGETLKPAKKG